MIAPCYDYGITQSPGFPGLRSLKEPPMRNTTPARLAAPLNNPRPLSELLKRCDDTRPHPGHFVRDSETGRYLACEGLLPGATRWVPRQPVNQPAALPQASSSVRPAPAPAPSTTSTDLIGVRGAAVFIVFSVLATVLLLAGAVATALYA